MNNDCSNCFINQKGLYEVIIMDDIKDLVVLYGNRLHLLFSSFLLFMVLFSSFSYAFGSPHFQSSGVGLEKNIPPVTPGNDVGEDTSTLSPHDNLSGGSFSRHSALSKGELMVVACSWKTYDFVTRTWSYNNFSQRKADRLVDSWLFNRNLFGWWGETFEFKPSLCSR